MISTDTINQIDELLNEGCSSYSSVCNLIDENKEVALQFIRQAAVRSKEFYGEMQQHDVASRRAGDLSNSCLHSIQHIVQKFKLKFPFALGYADDKIIVVNAIDDIQIIEKLMTK